VNERHDWVKRVIDEAQPTNHCWQKAVFGTSRRLVHGEWRKGHGHLVIFEGVKRDNYCSVTYVALNVAAGQGQ
jgi:hypothetical protein